MLALKEHLLQREGANLPHGAYARGPALPQATKVHVRPVPRPAPPTASYLPAPLVAASRILPSPMVRLQLHLILAHQGQTAACCIALQATNVQAYYTLMV